MKHFIVIVLFTALSIANIMAQNSRKAIHIVDGVQVENFDGSQLVGKTIKSYTIEEKHNIHIIFTSDYTKGEDVAKEESKKNLANINIDDNNILITNKANSQTTLINTNENRGVINEEAVVYVLDDKVVTKDDFNNLSLQKISSIEIIISKNSDERFKKFAKENTDKVMIITTKK